MMGHSWPTRVIEVVSWIHSKFLVLYYDTCVYGWLKTYWFSSYQVHARYDFSPLLHEFKYSYGSCSNFQELINSMEPLVDILLYYFPLAIMIDLFYNLIVCFFLLFDWNSVDY